MIPTKAQAEMLQKLAQGWEIHKMHGFFLVHVGEGRIYRLRSQRTPPVLLRHNWIEFSHREHTTDVYGLTLAGSEALERFLNTQS